MMKKQLLLLFSFFSMGFFAQQSHQLEEAPGFFHFSQNRSTLALSTKALATCDEDTVQFTLQRATGLLGISLNNSTSATALSQYFDANQNILVSGAQFYAYKTSATPTATTTVTVNLYLAGADSLPAGSPLATTTVSIDTTFGGGLLSILAKQANFAAPVTVSQPYIISVENNSTDNVALITNDYNALDGMQDWYSSALLGTTWLRGYNLNIGASTYDADALIEPFITVDLDADFSASPMTWTSGPTMVNFTDNSSSILNERMYSVASFLNVNNLSYTWDYGDGSTPENAISPSHSFANVQNYYVTLSDTLYGWTRNCVSEKVKMLGSSPSLVISEIMYNPPESGTDSLEYIEIYNAGITAVDLTDFYFGNGVTYTFPSVSIPANDYIVVCVDSIAIDDAFGIAAYQWTSGGLSNSGEAVTLKDPMGNTIDSVFYDDVAPWPVGFAAGQPDGGGSSLILCNIASDNNDGSNWSTSAAGTGIMINGFELAGSPGVANFCCSTVFGTDVVSSCGSYTWIDNNTYTASNNTATHTIVGGAANGCDSTVTLNLTINTASTGTDVQTVCGSLTWIDNNTYTTDNNTATHTIVGGAANGCDSIVTLDLTIVTQTTGTDVQTACGSFTWIDNNTYTTDNNTATHTIVGGAASGCDSIVTLNLTIVNATSGTDVQTACGSFTWIDNNTYTSDNNTATHTIIGGAANGCDSIVTLDLTIVNATSGTDVQTACGSFTWIDNNTYTASNNTATHTIIAGAANGCDSVVTLDLTIISPAMGVDIQTACGSFTWIDNNTYTASNNTATHTIIAGAANGCDSVVTLDLTITTVDVSITNNDPTLMANATGSTYQWIDCDNGNSTITGANSASYTPSSNGNFAVEVTTNGCTETSACVAVLSTSISSNEMAQINLYPNPTSGQVQILNPNDLKLASITVKDELGRVVMTLNNLTGSQISFELTEAPGVYFVTVTNDQSQGKTFKVIKK